MLSGGARLVSPDQCPVLAIAPRRSTASISRLRCETGMPSGMAIAGLLLISLIFGTMHEANSHRELVTLLRMHYGILCPVPLLGLVATYHPAYKRFSQYLLTLCVLVFAGTFMAMEGVAPTVPGSEASQTTVVLILTIMGACLFPLV